MNIAFRTMILMPNQTFHVIHAVTFFESHILTFLSAGKEAAEHLDYPPMVAGVDKPSEAGNPPSVRCMFCFTATFAIVKAGTG